MTHFLKIYPWYFHLIEIGVKTFEVRLNDRDYKVGDVLCLKEYCHWGIYTGRSIRKTICYILDDPEYCKEGYVILGIK